MSFEKIFLKSPSDKSVEDTWRQDVKKMTDQISYKLRILPDEEYFRINDEKDKFVKGLQTKYGEDECRQFAMYHYLIGHSPWKNEHFDKIDFPEEDSVEKFYTDLLSKN